ncbi:MAG: 8-oxo-dGTP diphosphatase [bacterium]
MTVETSSKASFNIDWDTWVPVDVATLCFIRKEGKLLLIHKKRGLGKGKINAPGGRLEKGETLEQTAIRETQEEVGLTPIGLAPAGRLEFAFTDGYSLQAHVFTATDATGTLTETDEAIPFWCDENDIPYNEMWSDDRLWIPLMLDGTRFEAQFIFENDQMLWHKLTCV